jgi:hypothetical protein
MSTAIETYTAQLEFAKKYADGVARLVGYHEPVTDVMRLRVIEAHRDALNALNAVVNEAADAVARAAAISPEAGTLAQQIDAIRKRIEAANEARRAARN